MIKAATQKIPSQAFDPKECIMAVHVLVGWQLVHCLFLVWEDGSSVRSCAMVKACAILPTKGSGCHPPIFIGVSHQNGNRRTINMALIGLVSVSIV